MTENTSVNTQQTENTDSKQSKPPAIRPPKTGKGFNPFSFLSFLKPSSTAKIPKNNGSSIQKPTIKNPTAIRRPRSGGSSKKKLLIVVFAFLFLTIIVLLIAVLKKNKPQDSVGERGKLVWWGQRDKNIVQPLIEEYEESHPDVKIDYQQQDSMDYTIRLKNLIAKEQAPDIFSLHNTWMPEFRLNLDILPSNIMDTKTFNETFYPAAVGALTTTQGAVGIPLSYDALVLYINQDLFSTAFATPPETWDDFRVIAQFLTDAPGDRVIQSGAAMSLLENVDHWQEIVALLMVQNGVSLNKPLGDRAEDVLTYYTSFASRGVKIWDDTLPDSVLAFANNKLAMLFAPTYRSNEIRRINPNLRFITVTVPQIPQAEPESPLVTYSTFWFEGVWNRSVNNDIAWDFLKFMTERESQTKMAKQYINKGFFPEIYARKDMAIALKEDPVLGSAANLGDSSVSWFLAGNTEDADGEMSRSLSDAYAQSINARINGGRGITVTLNQSVQAVLTKYSLGNRTQLPVYQQN